MAGGPGSRRKPTSAGKRPADSADERQPTPSAGKRRADSDERQPSPSVGERPADSADERQPSPSVGKRRADSADERQRSTSAGERPDDAAGGNPPEPKAKRPPEGTAKRWPGPGSWLQRYRLLVVAYGVALVVGAREYLVARNAPGSGGTAGCEASAASCFSIRSRAVALSDSAFWTTHARMMSVVAEVNPEDPNTEFLRGIQALARGDEAEFVRRFEQAIASGAKHNHLLLQYYAQSLLDRGGDWRDVNRAVNRWRENHPFSSERLTLQLGAGPSSAADADALAAAFASVPWLEKAELEPYVEGGTEKWRVLIGFRPGRPVDVREAVAAATVLAIPAEQRRMYEVTCSTLQDCSATLRSRP